MQELRVSTSRVVTYQHLDTTRLEEVDRDMHEFLDVVDAHHESERIGLLASKG